MSTRDEFPGIIGRDHETNNAVSIHYTCSINGSGEHAFGGASKWPCLRVQVDFEEQGTDKMMRVGKQIEELLRREGLIMPIRDCGPIGCEHCRRHGHKPFSNLGSSFGGRS